MPDLFAITAWVAVAACFGAGFVIWIRSKTYRTCAVCLFLIGGITAFYRLLQLLRPVMPVLANTLFWCASCLLGVFLLAAAVTGFFVVRTAATKPDAGYPYLLVLGCVVNGKIPTRSLRDRIAGAADYLRANPQTVCIVSGGLGPRASITEAECMFRELIVMGIEPERIWLEEQAKNTWQNLQFSSDLIEKKTGVRPAELAVVSSEYHMFRAGLMAKKQGLRLLPVPAKTGKFILRLNYTLREIGAVWRMLLSV